MAEAPAPAPKAPENGYISNPFEFIKPGWEAFKLNWTTLILIAVAGLGIVAAAGVIMVILGVAGRGTNNSASFLLFMLVVLAAAVALVSLFPAYPVTLLKSARGEKIGFKEAYATGRPYMLRMVGIGILTGLAVIGGFILFIIPGFIFMAWFLLAIYVCIDENLDVISSMKRSKELATGHVWEMLGLQAMPTVFGILNIIPILGWIASTLLGLAYSSAQAIRYDQLKHLDGKPTKPHVANYVLVLLFPVALALGAGHGVLDAVRNNSRYQNEFKFDTTNSNQ